MVPTFICGLFLTYELRFLSRVDLKAALESMALRRARDIIAARESSQVKTQISPSIQPSRGGERKNLGSKLISPSPRQVSLEVAKLHVLHYIYGSACYLRNIMGISL